MKLIILGCGGYGHTIADVADQTKLFKEIRFLDDNVDKPEVVGRISDFKSFIDSDTEFYPAVGNNKKRIEWMNKLDDAGAKIATIIHPSAFISPKASIDKGTAVLPGAIVNTGVEIGKGCIINIGAIIDHDTVLECGVHIAPGAIVKGQNRMAAFLKVESGTVVETGGLENG